MATIERYQTSSGATLYRVRYRTPDHRQTDKRGFATKKGAEAFAASMEVSRFAANTSRPACAGDARGTGAGVAGAPAWASQAVELCGDGNHVADAGAASLGQRRSR